MEKEFFEANEKFQKWNHEEITNPRIENNPIYKEYKEKRCEYWCAEAIRGLALAFETISMNIDRDIFGEENNGEFPHKAILTDDEIKTINNAKVELQKLAEAFKKITNT